MKIKKQTLFGSNKINKSCKTKAFVIENVKGMKSLYNGEVIREILSRKELVNYHVNFKILNVLQIMGFHSLEKEFLLLVVKDYKVENFS